MTPEESVPSLRPMPDGAILAVWVIYDHPKDCPNGYVLRCQWAMQDKSIKVDTIAWRSSDLGELHAILPPGLYRQMRLPGDDPAILETWF